MASLESKPCRLDSGERVELRTLTAQDAYHFILFLKTVLNDGSGMVALPGEISTDPEIQKESIEALRQDPRALLLAVFKAGSLIAFLDFRPWPRLRLRHGGEFGISVAPLWRGRGIGRILMSHFLEWAQTSPVKKINLRVRADNHGAIKLYKEFGFLEQGRFPYEIQMEDGTYVEDVSMYILV